MSIQSKHYFIDNGQRKIKADKHESTLLNRLMNNEDIHF